VKDHSTVQSVSELHMTARKSTGISHLGIQTVSGIARFRNYMFLTFAACSPKINSTAQVNCSTSSDISMCLTKEQYWCRVSADTKLYSVTIT
jgi:hypothetical protein